MKKRLNNKGYMLVEIILASVLAMGVAYFIMDLSIKLKNKNDDLLVKTLVYTDQAIIYNKIMEDLYSNSNNIDCSYIEDKLDISNNTFTYNGFKNIITEYATVGAPICTNFDTNSIKLTIPISVEQLPEEHFDVVINFAKNNAYQKDFLPCGRKF